MSDPSDPKHGDRSLDADSETTVDPDALTALEAGIRGLRDLAVSDATMARMRAGLDARIEASPDASRVTPISSHPRWRTGAGLLAAAAAVAVLLLSSGVFDSALESSPPGSPMPPGVAQDEGAPPPTEGSYELDPSPRVPEDVGLAIRPETGAAPISPDEALAAATDEELAIALDYELLSDYDVIAQLDLLELLDDREPADGVGSPAPEGRI